MQCVSCIMGSNATPKGFNFLLTFFLIFLLTILKRACARSSSIKYGTLFLIYSFLGYSLSYLFDIFHSMNHHKVKLTAKRRPFSSVVCKDISHDNQFFHRCLYRWFVMGFRVELWIQAFVKYKLKVAIHFLFQIDFNRNFSKSLYFDNVCVSFFPKVKKSQS